MAATCKSGEEIEPPLDDPADSAIQDCGLKSHEIDGIDDAEASIKTPV
jgi:hypothetical protein